MVPVRPVTDVVRPPRLLLVLLLLAALAGCVDEPAEAPPGEGPTGTPGGGRSPDGVTVDPPTWTVGDHWTYRPTEGEPTTFVVVEDTGTDWIIGTDSTQLSFFHAQEEVSTLGAQRKSDLAGSQGSDRVAFFQWPLTDGAEWTTTWDGVERTITATASDDGTWSFAAREGDNVTVRYGYDPAVAWFTELTFLAPDGSVGFAWTLEEAGHGWTGETYTWALETILSFDETSSAGYSAQPEQFEVPESATDVWARFDVRCTQGALVVGVHPVPWDAGAAGQRWNRECTTPWMFEGSLGHLTGTWSLDFAWQGASPADVAGEVYVRTLQPRTVG